MACHPAGDYRERPALQRPHSAAFGNQADLQALVNASVLKVKLALSIIGISSIHLLKTFINAGNSDAKVLMWQTIIHVAFLFSALAIAYTDKLIHSSHAGHH